MLIVLLSIIAFELFVVIRLLTNMRLLQDGESEARARREREEDRRSDMGWGKRTDQLKDMSADIRHVLLDILTEVRGK